MIKLKLALKLVSKIGSPKIFYYTINKAIPWLYLISIPLILISGYWSLFIAPMDYQQQDAFRIIYVHVPSALLSLSIYTIIAINSIIYIIWKIKTADIIAKISAPIGAAFTALALFTGAIWGKPMWGTWWVWDARLTSELILLFLYCGYIGLRSAFSNNKNLEAKISAILALIGMVDIPIIHFSVQWWSTLHQGATISKLTKPTIANEMLYPLLSMIVSFYLFYFLLACLYARNEILIREVRSSWLQKSLIIYNKD